MSEPRFKVGDQVMIDSDGLTYTVATVATIHTYALHWRDKSGVLMRAYMGIPESKLSEPTGSGSNGGDR